MKYLVIYRMRTSIYISTFNKAELLKGLNGEEGVFAGMRVLPEFPDIFQTSYGGDLNREWPEQSLLILANSLVVVPKITKKLVYYSLED